MIDLDLQIALAPKSPLRAQLPSRAQFKRWVRTTVDERKPHAELSLRIVDEAEGAELNQRYRNKSGPTNVLSFPFEAPCCVPDLPLLGDIVICAPVVEREAHAQGKSLEAHWAHLVVHGCLHLLGYDHIEPDQAEQMEGLERDILDALGYANPY